MNEKPAPEKDLGPLQPEFEAIKRHIIDIRHRAEHEPCSDDKKRPGYHNRSELPQRPKFEPWTFATDQPYNVISILGGRGSGKTTLLLKTAEQLLDGKKDIVLMPIQPERFRNHDTLLGWVLAGLYDWVKWLKKAEAAHKIVGTSFCEREKIEEVLQDADSLTTDYLKVRGMAVRAEAGINEYLKSCQEDTWEFSEDAAQVAADGYHLRLHLRKLLDNVFESYQRISEATGPTSPLLIIPVDDADVHRERVLSLLGELTVLATHPRVVVLLAGDWPTFAHAIRTEIADAARELREPQLLDGAIGSFKTFQERYVGRLMAKYLPIGQRVMLEDLAARERLEFVPFEDQGQVSGRANARVIDLLGQIQLSPAESQAALPSLAHYFDFAERLKEKRAETIIPSPYAELLPRSPRDLVQAHRKLQFPLREPAETATLAPQLRIRETIN